MVKLSHQTVSHKELITLNKYKNYNLHIILQKCVYLPILLLMVCHCFLLIVELLKDTAIKNNQLFGGSCI